MREDAVLPTGEEDHREFQALRGVQGHQGDHAVIGIGHRVGVGDQRELLQHSDEQVSGVLRDVIVDGLLRRDRAVAVAVAVRRVYG